jgi:hypothetical protein
VNTFQNEVISSLPVNFSDFFNRILFIFSVFKLKSILIYN